MRRKRIISLFLSFALAVSMLFTVNLDVKAISQNDVVSQLNSFISQYNGRTANKNQMVGGIQCKGFAGWVFREIFGVYIGNYPESANYKITNPDAQTVGILEPGSLNEATAKALLQKGVPGDFIQVQRSTARGRGPHSMILVGVNDNGIEVFDCNSDGRNTIKKYGISWSAFDTANRAMSLYHAHNYTTSSSRPSNPAISKSQHWYDLQDRIEITAHADGATSYFMSMFKDGNKIISRGVDGGKFSMDARDYGKGDYSVYFSCTNNAGTVDTKWIDFSVVGEAAYTDIRVSKQWYGLSDTVSISVDTICAKGQVIGIDKEGVGRVITAGTEPTYNISASKLGVGKYSAYFSVYNGSGGIDTRRVEFEIADNVNIGNDFQAMILNKDCWKPIMVGEANRVFLSTETVENLPRQLWHFTYNADDSSYCIQSHYNKYYLDVAGGSDCEGAAIQVWEENKSLAQRWFVIETADGYKLKPACATRIMDVLSGSENDGTPIQLWTANGTSAQNFAIYKLDGERDKISYDLLSDSASIGIGEKTKITIANARYGVDYKLHIVSPNGKTNTINLGTQNTYDFFADTKGIYKIYASVKSPVSSYSGTVNNKCIEIAVGYDYQTSDGQSVVFGGHLYQLIEKKNVNWVQAKGYCEAKNSYLSAITSEAENSKVAGLIGNYGGEAYIGGVRKDGENFRWVVASGEDFTYSNWREGEPNYHNHGTCQIRDPYGEYAKENYIGMYVDGTWNDYMVISSSINAFVMESTVTSIRVSEPTGAAYKKGDRFDKNSIVVEAEFSDGSKRKVTDYAISGFNPDKPGVQEVTISYYGFNQSIYVTVESDSAEKDPVSGQPGDGRPNDKDTSDKDKPDSEQGNKSDKDETNTDENDTDLEEEMPDKDDEEEPDILEVGDVIEDVKSGDEYEIISLSGSVICVEYMESANPKAMVIKIPAVMKMDDGTVCKVTSISKCAFKNNKRLRKVVIGSNVKVIGTKAFSNCKNLTSVTIGKNVTAIGANAFSGCTKLMNLTIPAKVTKIGSNAFSGCTKLKKLNIKSKKLNIKGLHKKALKGIPIKTVIQVPKAKQKVYKKVFSQRGLSKKNRIR